MNGHAILNEKHEVVPCDDLMTWANWFENHAQRVVKQDAFGDVRVSTVFLGLDHGFGGPPLWFETMIFGGEHDQYQDRYATWDEAIQGHAKAVELVELSPQSGKESK